MSPSGQDKPTPAKPSPSGIATSNGESRGPKGASAPAGQAQPASQAVSPAPPIAVQHSIDTTTLNCADTDQDSDSNQDGAEGFRPPARPGTPVPSFGWQAIGRVSGQAATQLTPIFEEEGQQEQNGGDEISSASDRGGGVQKEQNGQGDLAAQGGSTDQGDSGKVGKSQA
ncbi:hypothetical protein ACHAQH_008897 [Verticillium albo-atrum]